MDPKKVLVPACLPEELQLEILYRLPVKSVLQCMCVCKSWLSLIKSSAFVSTHISRSVSSAKGQQLFFLRYSSIRQSEHYSLHLNDQSFTCYMRLPRPPRRPNLSVYVIIGSCNGLVCLADLPVYPVEKFFLWNPSLGKLITLPKPKLTSKSQSLLFGYNYKGFGFDSRAKDYKVVNVRVAAVLKVEVFSLNSGFWKTPSDFEPEYDISDLSSPVYTNGRVHWLASDHMNTNGRVLIFDLADEFLCEISVPDDCSDDILNVSAVAYGDSSIALVHLVESYRAYGIPQYQFWVMNEYSAAGSSSWTKVGVMPFDPMPKVLRLRNSREVIVVQSGGELVSVDLISGEIKQLGIRDILVYCCFLGCFEESLALLDKQHNAGDETSDGDEELVGNSAGDETSDSDSDDYL